MQLLTVKEVAELTRFSVSTISHFVSDGRIPFKKVGRAVRFEAGEIALWIEKGGPPSPKVDNKIRRVSSIRESE